MTHSFFPNPHWFLTYLTVSSIMAGSFTKIAADEYSSGRATSSCSNNAWVVNNRFSHLPAVGCNSPPPCFSDMIYIPTIVAATWSLVSCNRFTYAPFTIANFAGAIDTVSPREKSLYSASSLLIIIAYSSSGVICRPSDNINLSLIK